jgi:AhpD family alkylhydroperoxidase
LEKEGTVKLDARTGRLIAVGASVTANCQPCLEINAARAAKHGADPGEIADAVEIGRMVRSGAAAKLDAFAAGLVSAPASSPAEAACGCGR